MCFHSLLLDCETPEAELRPKNRDLPEPSSAPGQGESERARREGRGGRGWRKAEGRGEKPLPTDSYRQGQLCTTSPRLDVHGHGALCPPSTAPRGPLCLASLLSSSYWGGVGLGGAEGRGAWLGARTNPLAPTGPQRSQFRWDASSSVCLWESHQSFKAELQVCHLQKAHPACTSSLSATTKSEGCTLISSSALISGLFLAGQPPLERP